RIRSVSYIRSTPFFPADDHTQPGITFADGVFQPYDQPAGSIFGSYSNLYQLKQHFSWSHGAHAFKWGTEIRVNRDSTIFGVHPNGLDKFGGGTAYSPVNITSASGAHDIHVGDPLARCASRPAYGDAVLLQHHAARCHYSDRR